MRNKKSVWKRVLIGIIIALLAISVVSMVATKLVYDSIFDRTPTDDATVPPLLTAMVAAREVRQYAVGEYRLCGYLYRSRTAQPQDALVVLAPGLDADADDYLWQISSLLDYGWSVFAFDATGSGRSTGESAVGFSQVLLDLEGTLDYLDTQNRFGYTDVVLFGHSRGGYAACCALRGRCDIAAVVSVSGINSAMEGVIGSAASYVGPFAYGNYGPLWLYQTWLFGSEVVGLEADEVIVDSAVPVLLVHGANDTQVPTDKYSIISYRDRLGDGVEYMLCAKVGQDGHTDLLFDASGGANAELMAAVNAFLCENVK